MERRYAAAAARVLQHVDSLRVQHAADGPEIARFDDMRHLALVVGQAVHETQFADDVFRDSTMAANLLWALRRQPPAARAMLWAHNVHVSLAPNTMGAHLRRQLRHDYFALGFATAHGSYRAILPTDTLRRWSDGHTLTPPGPGSVERTLSRMSAGLGGVGQLYDVRGIVADHRGEWLMQPREFREIGSGVADFGFSVSSAGKLFDALLFIPRTTTAVGIPGLDGH